eukprot:9476685-Pyramimonas_sp.AAC.1
MEYKLSEPSDSGIGGNSSRRGAGQRYADRPRCAGTRGARPCCARQARAARLTGACRRTACLSCARRRRAARPLSARPVVHVADVLLVSLAPVAM